jgi:hypothetical protein
MVQYKEASLHTHKESDVVASSVDTNVDMHMVAVSIQGGRTSNNSDSLKHQHTTKT